MERDTSASLSKLQLNISRLTAHLTKKNAKVLSLEHELGEQQLRLKNKEAEAEQLHLALIHTRNRKAGGGGGSHAQNKRVDGDGEEGDGEGGSKVESWKLDPETVLVRSLREQLSIKNQELCGLQRQLTKHRAEAASTPSQQQRVVRVCVFVWVGA